MCVSVYVVILIASLWYLTVFLMQIPLITKDAEHLFYIIICYLYTLCVKCLSQSFPIFQLGFVVVRLLSFKSFKCMGTVYLSEMLFTSIFSQSVTVLIVLTESFTEQKI